MFKKIKEKIGKTRNRNKILFWYLFVILVVAAYFGIFYSDGLFKSLLMSWGNDSFWESFNASLLQDVTFFGFVGIFPLIFWSLSPDDYLIDQRIRFISNSPDISQDAEDHFYKLVKKNLSYFKESNINITFRSMEVPNVATFECEIDAKHTVQVMCKHDDIDIDIKESVDCELKRNHLYGKKTLQYFGNKRSLKNEKITRNKQQFFKKGKIKRDSILEYTFKYQIFAAESSNEISWNDHSFRFRMSRYSEKCSISISNDTNVKIYVQLMSESKKSNGMFVDPKATSDVEWFNNPDATLSIPVPADGIILFGVRPENRG